VVWPLGGSPWLFQISLASGEDNGHHFILFGVHASRKNSRSAIYAEKYVLGKIRQTKSTQNLCAKTKLTFVPLLLAEANDCFVACFRPLFQTLGVRGIHLRLGSLALIEWFYTLRSSALKVCDQDLDHCFLLGVLSRLVLLSCENGLSTRGISLFGAPGGIATHFTAYANNYTPALDLGDTRIGKTVSRCETLITHRTAPTLCQAATNAMPFCPVSSGFATTCDFAEFSSFDGSF
jgi:hypothetical protein